MSPEAITPYRNWTSQHMTASLDRRMEKRFMCMNFSRICKVILVVSMIGCVQGCMKQAAPPAASVSSEKPSGDCTFGTSTAPGPYCGVSIFALIANPDKFYGKQIYTYGYLGVSRVGDMGLYYETNKRPWPDFFSCIGLEGKITNAYSEKASDHYVDEGVYWVAIYGKYVPSPNGICAGVIESPMIDRIHRIED